MASLYDDASSSSHPDGPQPSAGSTSYFGGARDFSIVNSRLTEVHGNQIINDASSSLKLLFKSISPGAPYDSAERSPAPRCHKDTRLSVIDDIMSWINESDRSCQLLWLNGAPGVGKSAISQTIAERCANERRLAGSYFFSEEGENRKTAERFFLTLAYQFSVAIPAVRDMVELELKADPHILSKSLSHQLERLILRPLSEPLELPPMIIIVDGLDECDAVGQSAILELVPTLLSGLPPSLCLLVASRPEAGISETFNNCLRNLSRRVTLDERYAPEKDIETFLTSTLAQISKRRIAQPWPPDRDITLLVNACSGQFLCAVTIVRYLSDGSQHPDKMLKSLLYSTSSKHAALTPLDSLYSRILSTCSNPVRLLEILGVIILSSCQIAFIEGLLGLEPGDVAQQLRGFNSVLHIPREEDKVQTIRIRQPSFREYLLDPSRSGQYFIDIQKQHARFATCMLRMHTQPNVPGYLLEIALEYWGMHCWQAAPIDDLLKALQEFDLRQWLKKSGEGSYSTSDLVEVMAWMSKTDHPSLASIHIKWRNICYEVFYADLNAFSLRPPDMSVNTFLALTVVASMAKHLRLDASVVCEVLEPFVADAETLWHTLDARIGMTSPFEPSRESFREVAEHLYCDTLVRRPAEYVVTHLDAKKLKSPDGTVLARYNLDNFNAFGRFKLDSAKCQTHFALACLAYVSSAAKRSRRSQSTRPHVCEARADSYARENWAHHVSNSLPTHAVLANLQDFIHEDHSQTHGNEKLKLVIRWLKGLKNPPMKLISCWESALRKVACGTHTTSVGGAPTSYRPSTPPPSSPPATPPATFSTPDKRKYRSRVGLKSSRI